MNAVKEYADNTKHICICTTISIILIFIFMISPLKNIMMSNFIGRLLIIVVLLYTIYTNTNLAYIFSNKMNVSLLNGDWDTAKTNVTCSYALTGFLTILLTTVLFRRS
jgi:hypothetical protein